MYETSKSSLSIIHEYSSFKFATEQYTKRTKEPIMKFLKSIFIGIKNNGIRKSNFKSSILNLVKNETELQATKNNTLIINKCGKNTHDIKLESLVIPSMYRI